MVIVNVRSSCGNNIRKVKFCSAQLDRSPSPCHDQLVMFVGNYLTFFPTSGKYTMTVILEQPHPIGV